MRKTLIFLIIIFFFIVGKSQAFFGNKEQRLSCRFVDGVLMGEKVRPGSEGYSSIEQTLTVVINYSKKNFDVVGTLIPDKKADLWTDNKITMYWDRKSKHSGTFVYNNYDWSLNRNSGKLTMKSTMRFDNNTSNSVFYYDCEKAKKKF